MATHTGGLTAAPLAVPAPALRAERLVRGYGERTVLDGLDLTLAPGEFIALLGRSGSGKSTFLRAVAGLDQGVTGSGVLDVTDRVSLSFQDSRLLPWARVLDNVALGLTGPDAASRSSTALAEVGLAGRERAWPHELSGGEQQRAALARALVRQPGLLLADEPFGALDALTRIKMHTLLRELYERHRPAVLLVTHDVDEAVELADRVLVLEHGRLALDLAIGLPAPRTRRDPRFQHYRDTLLAALGAADPVEPTDPADSADPPDPANPTGPAGPADPVTSAGADPGPAVRAGTDPVPTPPKEPR